MADPTAGCTRVAALAAELRANLKAPPRDRDANPRKARDIRRALADALEAAGFPAEAAEQRERAGDVLVRYVVRRKGKPGESFWRSWFESRGLMVSYVRDALARATKQGHPLHVALGGTRVYGPDRADLCDNPDLRHPHWGNEVRPNTYLPVETVEVAVYTLTPALAGALGPTDLVGRSALPILGGTVLDLAGTTRPAEKFTPSEKSACSRSRPKATSSRGSS